MAGLLANGRGTGWFAGSSPTGPTRLDHLPRQSYRAIPPEISAVNPIGSGDCLLAGLVDGWLSGLEPEPLFRHAIACAVANALVWDAGAIDPPRSPGGAIRSASRRSAAERSVRARPSLEVTSYVHCDRGRRCPPVSGRR